VQLVLGDVVVYGTYGIGRVVARERGLVFDVEHVMVVVEFEGGLRVSLPIERARLQLRALASEAEIEQVQQALREGRAVSSEPWLSRRRGARAKLSDGDPLGLAEIVCDGVARTRSLAARGLRPELASGERDVYLKARGLLACEIAQARGLDATEADEWIELQLGSA